MAPPCNRCVCVCCKCCMCSQCVTLRAHWLSPARQLPMQAVHIRSKAEHTHHREHSVHTCTSTLSFARVVWACMCLCACVSMGNTLSFTELLCAFCCTRTLSLEACVSVCTHLWRACVRSLVLAYMLAHKSLALHTSPRRPAHQHSVRSDVSTAISSSR